MLALLMIFMYLVYARDSHLGQKIIGALALYFLLSAAMYMFLYHDFVPSKAVFWPSLTVSLGVSIALIVFRFKALKNKTWGLPKEFSNYGRVKKVIVYPALSVVFFLLVWLNFYYLIPRAITSVVGEDGSKIDTAIVRKDSGRNKVCGFSMRPQSFQSLIFKICTNSVFYANSPGGNVLVEIHFKESPLGIIVAGIKRAQ